MYHSRSYKYTLNVNSFTVKIKHGDISHKYGLIDYFFIYEDLHYASITLLDLVKEPFLFNLKGNTTKNIKSINNKNIFNSIFSIVYLSDKNYIIKCENIICKCVLTGVRNQENFFYLSDFITESEHG